MAIVIKGLEQLIRKNNTRAKNVNATDIVNKGALIVQAQAKALSPVDTGALKASIDVDKADGGITPTARVYTDKEYAPHQEFGTVKMMAQPYMRPAAVIARPKVDKMAIKEIKKAMKA